MNAPNILKENIEPPSLTANPLNWWKWWITPRSMSREDRFYERNIRGISFVLMAILVLASIVFIPQGILAGYELLLTMMVLIIAIPAIAVSRSHLIIGGWTLSIILIFVSMVSLVSSGYWAPNAVGMVLIIPVLIALLVRNNRAKLFFGLIITALFSAIAFYQQSSGFTSIFDPSYSYSTPMGATIMFVLNMLLLGGGGGYLLIEFRSQQAELKSLVMNLEERVNERTSDLLEAKQIAEKSQAEAEKANQVKSQFLANMSHELRTPLNAILNFNAFVADGVMGPVNDEQVNLLNQSISSGKHLLALINDVLDITKIEAGMMDLFIQEVDLAEVLASVASVGKGLVKDKDIQFLAEIEEDLPVTFGDKRRLRQVFLNMTSNAIKFTDEGQVTLRVKKLDNSLFVEIQDTGLGIAKKDHHLVFESFKQAKHDFSETIGTGLGMPISKYFVESHQGKMTFDSDTGKGSTFYVELPILSEEEANLITLEIQEQ